MFYILIEEDTPTKLVNKVNEYLDRGWKCQGGVNALKYFAGYHLCVEYQQAMIKESK
jgi:hypothetical protein